MLLVQRKDCGPAGVDVLLPGQREEEEIKSREQHANQNIPAEILTPELSSLQNTCVEQNLCSRWSMCSKHRVLVLPGEQARPKPLCPAGAEDGFLLRPQITGSCVLCGKVRTSCAFRSTGSGREGCDLTDASRN